MGTGPRWHRTTKLMTAAVAGLSIATLPATPQTLHGQEVSWDRLDTLAVVGGGPTWSEPPFYRVFDAVLDNERNIVFLANGGDGARFIPVDDGRQVVPWRRASAASGDRGGGL